MNNKQLEILTNIIGAVESGGQIYGNRDYAAYAGAYENSKLEHTCTLGWAQNYGYEAMKLCKMIYEEDKEAFEKADTAGISAKLGVDWVATRWNPNNAEKRALIAIITTEAGKKCQDKLFMQLMESYISNALAYDKTMSIQAQMMWCEITHLGGDAAVKRIFNRASRPFTPDSIYASLLKDQQDTSNDNQVGDKKYESRHKKCVEWIKKYVPAEGVEAVSVTADTILNTARSWLGYSEANGRWWSIVNGVYNAYIRKTGEGRGYCLNTYDSWCDAFVSSCFIKNNAVNLIGEAECGVPNHIQMFKKYGIWRGMARPSKGWIVCFDWQNGRSEWGSDHIGLVESIDANGYITTIEGNYSDSVKRRIGLKWNDACISGYAQPKYGVEISAKEPEKQQQTTTSNNSVSISKKPIFEVVVTSNTLNARLGPGTEYGLCKTIKPFVNGEHLLVCTDMGNGWYYVKLKNEDKYCFVYAAYTRKVEASKTLSEPATGYNKALAGTYTVTADELNLRAGAGTDKPILKVLKNGAKLQNFGYYTEVGGYVWLYVAYNGLVGFVASEYVKK